MNGPPKRDAENNKDKKYSKDFRQMIRNGQTSYGKQLLSKKLTWIIEILIVIGSFLIFSRTNNPGVFLFTIILAICIAQVGKKPRKQPFDYLFGKNQANLSSDVTESIRYDQAYAPSPSTVEPIVPQKMMITEQKKKELYENFQDAAEYHTHWLNSEAETLNLKLDDQIILSKWTPLSVSMKVSFEDSVKRFLMLGVYFGIYAIISYFVFDRGEGNYDATVKALFFPFLPYILISYRGIDKYLKALLSSFFAMAVIFTPLFVKGIITNEGIPFLKYFIFIEEFFPGVVNLLVQATETENAIAFTNELLRIVFIFEFILLILHWVFIKRPEIHLVASEQSLFIRTKTKKSIWDIVMMVLWIFLNPFNISQYKEIQNRIRYNRLTAKEGRNHDYSKVSHESIEKWLVRKRSMWQRIILAIVFFVIGVFTLATIIGIPLIGLGVILFFSALRRRNTYKIYLRINRSLVEGSWVLSHQFDIFEFPSVPENVAQLLMKF
ncbi:MAG: hypothetical protein ACTSYU_05885 [Promethearchaeota archaeon]